MQVLGDLHVVSYWIDTLVLKTEGNTYATLLHHPFLFKGKPMHAQEVARRISGAIAGEIYAQVKTYVVPITNSSPSQYIICHLPLVFLSPTSPLPFYSPSLFRSPLFARFLCACVLDRLFALMASSPIIVNTLDNEVLNFKQREGENLKMLGIEFAMLKIDLLKSNLLPFFFAIFT